MSMKVLIVRHGKAGNREEWAQTTGKSDDQRPLTPKGKQEFQQLLDVIAPALSDVRTIISSPLVRTLQTAEMLQQTFADAELKTSDVLIQQTPVKKVLNLLCDNKKHKGILVLVGHENHLSLILSKMLTVKESSLIAFKKGGCALVDFDPGSKRACLKWMVQPSMFLQRLKAGS